MYSFYRWVSTAFKARATSRWQFTFTTKFPEVPGTYFIDLGKMNG